MATFTQDENGIFRSAINHHVFFPDSGHADCLEVEGKSFWFSHRNKIIEAIVNRFPFSENLADVGGGNGFQTIFFQNLFPHRKLFLVEPGYEGCLNARKRGVANVYNMNIEEFPIVNMNVKGLGLFDVLEHIPDDVKFLQNLYSNSPSKTRLYITTPSYMFLWSETDDVNGHQRRYTMSTMGKTAERAGWDITYQTYFFSFLPVLIYPSRCIPYHLGARKGFEKVTKAETQNHQGRGAEKILSSMHRFEMDILRSSSIPFGASLFTVLTKK